MSDPDVLLLRQKIHGLSADELAASLRERLPSVDLALARTPEEERDLIRTARVAVGFKISPDLLSRAENLDLFACCYAGTGHLPLAELEDHGVAVTSASGVHGPNIAEYVVGAITARARGFQRSWRQQREGRWQSFPTDEVQGSTVTIVGLGAIGTATVERLEPFGVETIGVRYTPEKGGPTDEVLGFDEIHDALARTDYLVLACPLTDTTRGLVGSDELLTLPPHAYIVNIARGPVVDTDALVSALRRNSVGGAHLDVTDPEPLPGDHPLWDFDDVTITPHNAGHTPEYYERLADIIADNLGRMEAGEELRNRVT